MTNLAGWLTTLETETRRLDGAEEAIRAEFAHRLALAADERAIAYRRLNLVRALNEATAGAADGDDASNRGLAWLRARFDWDADPASPHGEIAALFAPVCRAVWVAGREQDAPHVRHAEEQPEAASRSTRDGRACFEAPLRSAPQHDEGRGRSQVSGTPAEALASFERAYAERTGTSFWILFDNPMPETPRVDY